MLRPGCSWRAPPLQSTFGPMPIELGCGPFWPCAPRSFEKTPVGSDGSLLPTIFSVIVALHLSVENKIVAIFSNRVAVHPIEKLVQRHRKVVHDIAASVECCCCNAVPKTQIFQATT